MDAPEKKSPFSSKSSARDFVVQFLYQCETSKLFYFSKSHFSDFVSHFVDDKHAAQILERYCQGIFRDIALIDERLNKVSTNWPMDRMPALDRAVLRLAMYELLEGKVPVKVVLNEAIELAKKYGTEKSPKFVNGILDQLAKEQGAV